MAEFDDDDFPNDFDGLDFDNIPELQAPTINAITPVSSSTVTQSIVPTATASPVQSSGSNTVEDMDPTFLAAVDALEARALSKMLQGDHPTDSQSESSSELVVERLNSSKSADTVVDSPKGEGTSSLHPVYEYLIQSSESSYTNRKGKRKAESLEEIDVRAMLSGYEAELTCPICCDLLLRFLDPIRKLPYYLRELSVAAHVANPCGHTCCGECGYEWLEQSKYGPTCAICRSSLSSRKPLLPNFVVDGFVQQHLQTLARSGRPEWQQKGYKTIEWNKRLESWKTQANDKAEKGKLKGLARTLRRLPRYYEVDDDFTFEPEWADDEGFDEVVPRILPRRGTRTRR